MKRRRRGLLGQRHLRSSMVIVSLLAIIGSLFASFQLSYALTRRLMRDSAIESSRRLLVQMRRSIDYYLESMAESADYLAGDPVILAYMSDERGVTADAAVTRLTVVAGTRSDFRNLVLIRSDGALLTHRRDVRVNEYRDVSEQGWYVEAAAAGGRPVYTSSRVENLFFGEYPWVITMSRAMYSGGRQSGVLLIDLNYKSIEGILSAAAAGDNRSIYFIAGGDGRLVYHPQQQLIYSGIKSEQTDIAARTGDDIHQEEIGGKMYTSVRLKATDWVIVSVLDTASLVKVPWSWISIFVAVGLVFAAIVTVLSWLAARKLTEPLLVLQQAMKAFEQGDMEAKAEIVATSEIADLGHSFNTMTEQIARLVEQKVAAEEQKRASELLALQAQIRPHFLYNTLESIIWMAELGDKDNVVLMTSSLSKLLRAQIAGQSEMISLAEEISYTRHYLTIQKMRYGDRLNYEFHIEPDLENAQVLRLFLQPLVENAIDHGIRGNDRPGLIQIRAFQDDGELVVEVADNGRGFDDPDAWRRGEHDSGGIGLANVEERLKLFFGRQFGVSISSRRPGDDEAAGDDQMTTTVRMRLPLLLQEGW